MRQNRRYTHEPLGRVRVMDDFLPPPDQLVLRDEGVKVTLSLGRKSVEFFKAHEAQSKVPYQRMIRTLLDNYADRHSVTKAVRRPRSRRPA